MHKEGENVSVDVIKSFLKKKRVVLLRTYLLNSEHYVIITDIDDKFAYIRDPYFLDA